jgi:hypothetical protein
LKNYIGRRNTCFEPRARLELPAQGDGTCGRRARTQLKARSLAPTKMLLCTSAAP